MMPMNTLIPRLDALSNRLTGADQETVDAAISLLRACRTAIREADAKLGNAYASGRDDYRRFHNMVAAGILETGAVEIPRHTLRQPGGESPS